MSYWEDQTVLLEMQSKWSLLTSTMSVHGYFSADTAVHIYAQ